MRFFLIASAVLLAACSTPQSTQYFVLPDSQFIYPNKNAQELAVKVFLTEPLNNGGLVYQTDAYHLNFARNHLWANTLDNALEASLSNKLNRLNSQYIFVPASRSQNSRLLKVYIEAFQGRYQGQALVSGYALWPNGQSKAFSVETTQQGDGYAAMVEALNQGIEKATISMNQ